MKKIITISIIALSISFCSYSQSVSSNRPSVITRLQQQDNSKGQLQIIQDKKIDDFLSRIIDNNNRKGTVPGYRIQIFSKNSQKAQEEANAARAKFLNRFPDIEPYYVVEAPYWRVYAGNFRTYTDALRIKKQIADIFPNALINKAEINYNKL